MTECYALVRGSTLRVTALDAKGAIPSSGPVRYAVSRSPVSVTLDPNEDSVGVQTDRGEDDRVRTLVPEKVDVLGWIVGASFLRVEPGLLNLMTGVPLVLDAAGDVVGYDADSKIPITSFALEVWSKLSGPVCANGPRWGYTFLPFLSGGFLTGFSFNNQTVRVSLRDARTRLLPGWQVGPYDFEGYHERPLPRVSGNDTLRQHITAYPPPDPTEGITEFMDRISNGSASDPHPLQAGILAGGSAAMTSPWIVHGGRA